METQMVDAASDARVANNVVRHEYRVLSDAEKDQMKRIKDLGLLLHDAIAELGESEEVAWARMNARQAVMWAVNHITR